MNGENNKLIRGFMNAFEKKDVKVLEEFFHPNVVFRNYGDKEVRGREELLKVWSHVFGISDFGNITRTRHRRSLLQSRRRGRSSPNRKKSRAAM